MMNIIVNDVEAEAACRIRRDLTGLSGHDARWAGLVNEKSFRPSQKRHLAYSCAIATTMFATAVDAQISQPVTAPAAAQPVATQTAEAQPVTALPIAAEGQAQPQTITSAQLLASDAAIPPDQIFSQTDAGPSIGRAGDDIDFALGQRQIYSDLRTLAERITDMRQTTLNFVARRSTQSDELDISHYEISLDLFFSQGRSRVRPGFQALKYSSKFDAPVLHYAEGVTGNIRLSDGAAVAGEFWLNQLKPEGLPNNILATYNFFATLFPSDYVRFDINTNRVVFDNIRSLRLGITARNVGGSIDYTPSNRLRLTLRGGAGFYSDRNRRRSGEAEAIWRVESSPVIELGVRATAFRFEKLLSNGYFNPKHYKSAEAMLRLQHSFSDKLYVQVAGSGGVEDADPNGSKPIVKSSFEFSYRVFDGWTLDGGVNYFSSRTATSSGFSRRSFTLGLHHKFK